MCKWYKKCVMIKYKLKMVTWWKVILLLERALLLDENTGPCVYAQTYEPKQTKHLWYYNNYNWNLYFIQGNLDTLGYLDTPGYLDTWIPGYLDTWIHVYRDTWIDWYLDTWIPGYMYTWIDGYMDTWVNGYMETWIHGYTDSWIHGHMDTCINKFRISEYLDT